MSRSRSTSFAVFWQAWWEAGLPQPVEYDADRLVLQLDLLPTDDADQVLLVERDHGAGQQPGGSSGLDR